MSFFVNITLTTIFADFQIAAKFSLGIIPNYIERLMRFYNKGENLISSSAKLIVFDKEVIYEQRGQVLEIAEEVAIGGVQNILTTQLDMKKVSARW